MLDQDHQRLPDKFEYPHCMSAGYCMDMMGRSYVKKKLSYWELKVRAPRQVISRLWPVNGPLKGKVRFCKV